MIRIRTRSPFTVRRLALGCVALAALAGGAFALPSPARAGGNIQKELMAANAHHFAKPLVFQEHKRPVTLERDYQEQLKRTSWRLSEGPVSVSISLTRGGPPDSLFVKSPVLSLSVGGEEVLKVEGSQSFPDNPIFLVQIAEMDPGNPYKEVVFSTYTGGAHCCSDTRLLTSSKDGRSWKAIEVGQFDGGPLEARDLDGDGRYEFSMRDNTFLYAFSCYACSAAPISVLQLDDGRMINISSRPAFRARHVDSLKNMVGRAVDGMDANGFLAGYVGQKILLGEGAEAWKFMLKHYDRKSDWGRESCTVKVDGKSACPPDRKVMLSYPRALERFLKDAGYVLKK